MKKLIALAVAAAAMPAMADISLSGSTRVEYVDNDSTSTIERSDLFHRYFRNGQRRCC